jgi:hypothetical protein
MHHKKISNTDWKIIKDKFKKKLSCLKGKLLSYDDRLVLINSILSSLAMFMLSFFEKMILHKLDFYTFKFFWQGDKHKKIPTSKMEHYMWTKRSRRTRSTRP